MTKQTLKNVALTLGLLGLGLLPSTGLAQVGLGPKLPGKHPASATTRAASHQTKTPGAPSSTYTLLSFPETLSTSAEGINLGATTSKMEIVGGAGQGGFLARVSEKKLSPRPTRRWIIPMAQPHRLYLPLTIQARWLAPMLTMTKGMSEAAESSPRSRCRLLVPWGTFPYGINNSGEIVGGWWDSNRIEHGFTLIGGTYTSFDYPGATETAGFAINSAGDIVGPYSDASGVEHAFLLSGGAYSSFDFPGADFTVANGINDAGDIVGIYCTTTGCISTSEGEQGFLLSAGVFTTISIPGEFFTAAQGINNNGEVVGLLCGCRRARCLVPGGAVDGLVVEVEDSNFQGYKERL